MKRSFGGNGPPAASHGVVDQAALDAVGVSRRVAQRQLLRLGRGIFGLPSETDEWTAIAAGQLRWPATVLTGASALRLHGCDGSEHAPTAADLRALARSRAPYPRVLGIGPADVTTVQRIRVLRPLPLLARVAETLDADIVEAALETFLRRQEIGEAEIWRACGAAGGPPREGRRRRALAAVMDRRGWGIPPTESYLETLTVQRVLRLAGLGHQRQVVISLGGTYLKRYDFRLDSGLLLNCHGMAYHTSRAAVQQDAAYGLRLRLAGLEVETITWDDVTRRPWKTARDLAARSAQVAARGGGSVEPH